VFQFSYVYSLPFGKGKKFRSFLEWICGCRARRVADEWTWHFDNGLPLAIPLANSRRLPTYGTQRPNLIRTADVHFSMPVIGNGNPRALASNHQRVFCTSRHAAYPGIPTPATSRSRRSLILSRSCAAFSNSNFFAASRIRSSSSPMNCSRCFGDISSTSSSRSTGTVT
jgi:hypothetical protein